MKKFKRTFFVAGTAFILAVGAPYISTPGTCGITLPLVFTGAFLGCSDEKKSADSSGQGLSASAIASETRIIQSAENQSKSEIKVTFVELGSVNCIPCKMMKPVMEKVEQKYNGQVKVVFHDVWTPEGRTSGAKYAIRVIPTQVFLDKDGKEYFRHEGFFPFEEVDKILKQKGVN